MFKLSEFYRDYPLLNSDEGSKKVKKQMLYIFKTIQLSKANRLAKGSQFLIFIPYKI